MSRLSRPMIFLWLLVAAIPSLAAAQVINGSAGTSSFLNSSGFALDYKWLPVSGWAGLAAQDDGVHFGGYSQTTVRGFDYGAGDQTFPFDLDTDVFDPSTYVLYGRGLSIRHQDKEQGWMLFGGTAAHELATPFVRAYEPSGGIGAFFYQRTLSPRWVFHSFNIGRDQFTSIQSVGFKVDSHWNLATAAGVGSNHGFYSAASTYKRKWFDLTGSYTADGNNFHRVEIAALPYTERTGANLRADISPWKELRVELDHQTTLSPIFGSTNSLRATLDAASVATSVEGFSVHGGISKSEGGTFLTTSRTLDFTRQWGSLLTTYGTFLRFRTQSSKPYDVYLLTSEEHITPRFSVRQTITHSDGNTTLSWGGSILTNPVSVSLDYETIFNPVAGGFNGRPLLQTWAAHINFALPHGLRFHYDNFVDPFGKLRYTAYLSGIQFAPRTAGEAATTSQGGAVGRFLARGKVQDEQGRPVWGVAVRVDGQSAYSGRNGEFYVGMNRRKTYPLSVDVQHSISPGAWEVVSAPSSVAADTDDKAAPAKIIVRRAGAPAPPVVPAAQPASAEQQRAAAVQAPAAPPLAPPAVPPLPNAAPNVLAPALPQAVRPSAKVASPELAKAPLQAAGANEAASFTENMRDVYFDFDKSDIRKDARETLTTEAAFLRTNPDIKFAIEGSCDEHGNEFYNLALGYRRALAVRDFFVKKGIVSSRMNVLSCGMGCPACNERNKECWQKNRRVHFRLRSE